MISMFDKKKLKKPVNIQSILSTKLEHKRKMKNVFQDIIKRKKTNKNIHSDLLNEYSKYTIQNHIRYETKSIVTDFQWNVFIFL